MSKVVIAVGVAVWMCLSGLVGATVFAQDVELEEYTDTVEIYTVVDPLLRRVLDSTLWYMRKEMARAEGREFEEFFWAMRLSYQECRFGRKQKKTQKLLLVEVGLYEWNPVFCPEENVYIRAVLGKGRAKENDKGVYYWKYRGYIGSFKAEAALAQKMLQPSGVKQEAQCYKAEDKEWRFSDYYLIPEIPFLEMTWEVRSGDIIELFKVRKKIRYY